LLPRLVVEKEKKWCEIALRARKDQTRLLLSKTNRKLESGSIAEDLSHTTRARAPSAPSRLSPASTPLSQRDYNVTVHHLTTTRTTSNSDQRYAQYFLLLNAPHAGRALSHRRAWPRRGTTATAHHCLPCDPFVAREGRSLSRSLLMRIGWSERHVGGIRCWIFPVLNAALHCARARRHMLHAIASDQ
jgi:hypothetical protein